MVINFPFPKFRKAYYTIIHIYILLTTNILLLKKTILIKLSRLFNRKDKTIKVSIQFYYWFYIFNN